MMPNEKTEYSLETGHVADVRPHDPRGPNLTLGGPPPDHVSQQIARRRTARQTEMLETLQFMDAQLAKLTHHRNGHAARIRQYARDNHQELEDASLLTRSQRALKMVDLGLRALAITPEAFDAPAKLRAAMLEAGVDGGYADAFVAFHAAWTTLAAGEIGA